MHRTEPISFNGMPAVRWRSRDGAAAIATLQGAHLVSWTPAGGEESLFVSERSPFEAGKAIRGGIPVCFPQFAERGPLVKHGFARTSEWKLGTVDETKEGARASFSLESSAQTLAAWPHAFRLELAATLGGSRLDLELRVANTGQAPFEFAAALHTYFRIKDLPTARLHDLCGVVTPAEPIDRIYFAPPPATRLEDAGRMLRIEQRGFADTVVWNPGSAFTAKMPDMPPEGHRHMLCVEAAAIDPKIVLAPGDLWTGSQSIAAEELPAQF